MVMMRRIDPEKGPARATRKRSPAAGFTLVEVLISMLVTLIVMSAVFGLLSRGQSTFQREPEIADMQQTARAALDMVTRDALQAGAGLPPEFPSFTTPAVDAAVGDGGANPDVIEIVGGLGGAVESNTEPEAVDPSLFTGDPSSSTIQLSSNRTNIEVGDLVIVYDDKAANGYWIMSYVQDVQLDGGTDQIELTLEPTSPDAALGGDVPANYQGRTPTIESPPFLPVLVTPVTVVRYRTVPDATMTTSGPPVNALLRQVNFGAENPVAYLEDFQVVYLVGGTTAADEADNPVDPQPNLLAFIVPADIVNGVSVSISARSLSENLQGATEGATPADGNFIRKSFSSNVNPRNIITGLAERCFQQTGLLCYQ